MSANNVLSDVHAHLVEKEEEVIKLSEYITLISKLLFEQNIVSTLKECFNYNLEQEGSNLIQEITPCSPNLAREIYLELEKEHRLYLKRIYG